MDKTLQGFKKFQKDYTTSKMGKSEKSKLKKAEKKAMDKKMSEGFANVKLANSKVVVILVTSFI